MKGSSQGDGVDKRMLDTAGQVADFAYKQGVGDAVAVDHLIQSYRAKWAEAERLREAAQHAVDVARQFDSIGRLPEFAQRLQDALDA